MALSTKRSSNGLKVAQLFLQLSHHVCMHIETQVLLEVVMIVLIYAAK